MPWKKRGIPKIPKPLQRLDAPLPFNSTRGAKLAILKPYVLAQRVAVLSGAGISVNAGSTSPASDVVPSLSITALWSPVSKLYEKRIVLRLISRRTKVIARQSVFTP